MAAGPGCCRAGSHRRSWPAQARRDLDGSYHRLRDACRILPGAGQPVTEPGLTEARPWLARAAQIVVANGLDLLGVTAPERL